MLDQEFTKIRIFMDSSALSTFNSIPKTQTSTQIQATLLSVDKDISNKDKLFIIFRPSNRDYFESNADLTCRNVLEDVQVICFHSALKKIPVLIIDPLLVSTTWNKYGNYYSPMLLGDFKKVSFLKCVPRRLLSRTYFLFFTLRSICGPDFMQPYVAVCS